MIFNIILAVLMLGIVIFIHEFGHFIVAKANGIAVVEFSIGFGPKLFSTTKNGTEYCFKLIPFGGACVMLGDDIISEPGVTDDEYESEEEDETASSLKKKYDESKSFANKPVWSRIAVIAAGPLFNFLLAFVFAVIIIGAVGTDLCYVDEVAPNSPASAAGIQAGDRIVKINNNNITFSKEYSFYNYYHSKDVMNITYLRDGQKYTTTVTPEFKKISNYQMGVTVTNGTYIESVAEDSPAEAAGLKQGDVILSADGIVLDEENIITDIFNRSGGKEIELVIKRGDNEQTLAVTPRMVEVQGYYSGFESYGFRQKVSPLETIGYAFSEVGYWIEMVVKSVGMMFTGQVGVNDLSGPVGVVDAVNTVVSQSKPDGAFYVMLSVLNFTVMLSANLGVMNLLPIPALDGGRLVFLFIELVRGKPIKKEREGMVHFVGMVLLMLLMVYVMFKDIVNLF